MRLTVGMLRQVIREEVEKVRRGRLHESMVDPELKLLNSVASVREHAVDFNHDKIVKMSRDECDDYGFPMGTLYCNVGGIEPYVKFPKGRWQHEREASVDRRLKDAVDDFVSQFEIERMYQPDDDVAQTAAMDYAQGFIDDFGLKELKAMLNDEGRGRTIDDLRTDVATRLHSVMKIGHEPY